MSEKTAEVRVLPAGCYGHLAPSVARVSLVPHPGFEVPQYFDFEAIKTPLLYGEIYTDFISNVMDGVARRLGVPREVVNG